MTDHPLAVKTFWIKKRVDGFRLIEAVEFVVSQQFESNTRFYCERRFEEANLYRIGVRGDNEKLNLVVMASKGGFTHEDWILRGNQYESVRVVSVAHTSDVRLCQSTNNNDVIDWVCTFADMLEEELSQ